jgi:biotin transporter BioY
MDSSGDAENLRLTQENIELLSEIGLLLRDDLGIVVSMLLAYGVYFVISGVALHSVLKREQKSRRTWLLFSALLVSFIVTSLFVAARTSTVFLRLQKVLIDPTSDSLVDRIDAYLSSPWRNSSIKIQIVSFTDGDAGLVFLINDALAAWRAIVISKSTTRSWVLDFLLCFLLFCSCGTVSLYLLLQLSHRLTLGSVVCSPLDTKRDLQLHGRSLAGVQLYRLFHPRGHDVCV